MEDSKEETVEDKIKRLTGNTKKQRLLLISVVLLILLTPIIFTQLPPIFDFTETGNIGDTIGGITAPFINLLAAFLVYRSFTAQIAANIQQKEDFDKQIAEIRLDRRAEYLKGLFDEIERNFEITEGRAPKTGSWVMFLRTKLSEAIYAKSIAGSININDDYRKRLEKLIKNPLLEIERNFEILILLVDELFAERNKNLYEENNLEIWYQHRLSTLMKKYHYLGFNDGIMPLYSELEMNELDNYDRDIILRIFDMHANIIQKAKLRSY
ncbi:hypothetical protein ACNR9Q_00955 [Maribacter sp. X9]|uniref:hypothetical protein n=1 Tax=Maribacter sp. X9 TaxID=3402159 RepID=UPI003AF3B91B